MRIPLIVASAMLVSVSSARAQSLRPQVPAPLQSGINSATIDNMVGTHYWSFTGGPGKTRIHVKYKSMTLLGNSFSSTATITLSDAANTWHTTKVLQSSDKPSECDFDGDLKAPTKLVLAIAPPSGGLVRMGGDYQVEATGAVSFAPKSTTDPVVGTYNQMNGYTTNFGMCKFLADGKIESTSGPSGKWKLFDEGSQTYVIDFDGQERHSLKLVPGQGLFDAGTLQFQLVP
jgi:hypothetical protein